MLDCLPTQFRMAEQKDRAISAGATTIPTHGIENCICCLRLNQAARCRRTVAHAASVAPRRAAATLARPAPRVQVRRFGFGDVAVPKYRHTRRVGGYILPKQPSTQARDNAIIASRATTAQVRVTPLDHFHAAAQREWKADAEAAMPCKQEPLTFMWPHVCA